MSTPSTRPLKRQVAIILPRGSGEPIPKIDQRCTFVIFEDSDVGRDLMDLDGPAGPPTFDIDVPKVLAEANKVIVSAIGPGHLIQHLMWSAERAQGYSIVVDTSSTRLAIWAELTVASRGGQKGLVIVGPRAVLPVELQDRCVAHDMILGPDDGEPTEGLILH